MQPVNIKEQVKKNYGQIARESCCPSPASCCSDQAAVLTDYSVLGQDVTAGSDLGLGCGMPTTHAAINKGETVLDLGSGAGVDVFISSKAVGPQGKVIGVDFTEDMIRNDYARVGLKVDRVGVAFHFVENEEKMEVLMAVGTP